MRYLTVRVDPPEEGGVHPVGRRLSEDPAVRREAIHHVELLGDGTVVTLAEGTGDRKRYEEIMREDPSVEQFLVSGEGRWMATSQFEVNESLRRLLSLRREFDLVVETPIAVTDDGGARLTYVGDEAAFQALFETAREVPDLDAEVLETGDYHPDADSFVRSLTERQQEVLEAAVEVGYYAVPRTATQADVADVVGIAPSTVGDHLRKIEAEVLGALAE
jgi:predicted DNA binding protein